MDRLGLEVVPFQEQGDCVDLVLVHRGEGASATYTVATSLARTPVPHVVVSDSPPDSSDLVGAVAGGARGWLRNDISDDAFSAAVADVLAGSLALNRSDVHVVVTGLQRRSERTVRRADDRLVQLSDREWEVLEKLAAGVVGAEVATLLGVSQAAVRGYVASAVRRLGARSRTEAVALFRAGASSPSP